jgi:hypothetical protein
MNKTPLYITLLLACCAAAPLGGADAAAAEPWRALLNDDSAPDWRGWKEPGFPAGWHVAGGVLSKDGVVDDLVTKESFGDFELELEWKIGKAGNSGVFYRGTREYDHIYWSAPEYQLLDDANAPDGRSRLTAAASAYALYGAPEGVVLPFDHWNKTRIVVKGTHVAHSLDCRPSFRALTGRAAWRRASLRPPPITAWRGNGLIGIQADHPGALAIRQIRIRVLP